MNYYHIGYNQNQGLFHFFDTKEINFGVYKVFAKYVPEKIALEFTEKCFNDYPKYNNGVNIVTCKLSLFEVSNLFNKAKGKKIERQQITNVLYLNSFTDNLHI